MRSLQLAMTLLARDQGSKVLRQALSDIFKQINTNKKADEDAARTREQSTQSGIRASRTLRQEYQRAASARSTLGIRSERDIQREIAQTQGAYNRLLRTGTLTANEQTRAFRAMTNQVSQLRTELNGAGQSMSRMERARMWGGNVTAIAGGVTAAAMIIKDPVQRQMAYEARNAEIANTGYNEIPPEERLKKIPVLNGAIRNAVRYGGGTPELTQEALNTLLSKGSVDKETAMKILPDVMRYSTASGANPEDLAKIASAAIANFGIKLEELPALFDKLIRSGENGGYELADMAKSMPTTMTKANAIGMSGLADVDKLAAWYQANSLSAGDNSQAATNVNNFLDKITSADTQNALKTYKFRVNGKVMNYTDYLAQQRMNGVSVPDAFMGAISGIVSQDKRVQSLRADAKKYKGTDREKEINAALDVVVASIISKIVADQQAGMALKTNILMRDYIKEQQSGTRNAAGAGAASFSVISSTNAFKSQQLESEKVFAEQDAMKPLADLYGDLSTKLVDYAKEYPQLTTALSGATTGIKAMTAAAVAFATLNFLTGGKITPSTSPVPPGKLPTGGSGSWGWGAKLLGAGMSATAIATFTTRDEDEEITNGPAKWSALRSRYSQERIDKARKLYQPWYQIGKGYASENEEWLSQLDKDEANGTVPSWWTPPTNIRVPESANGYPVPPFARPPAQQPPINITTKLELDGRVIAEAVNEVNNQSAARGPQGGPH
ncbi:TPA: phage tail tape measure protein [Klebsiella pneumoniae]|nr:phage tail tape measure protein [Klebsiella pneumoniae]